MAERLPATPDIPIANGASLDESPIGRLDPVNDPTELAELGVRREVADGLASVPPLDFTPYMSVVAEIRPDRSALVVENIYQWFDGSRRGIFRTIPMLDDLGSHGIRSLTVSTSSGTPDDVVSEGVKDGVSFRIGDENVNITGLHHYRLEYVIENIVTIEPNRETVALDALSDWNQWVERLDYTIVGPDDVESVRCFNGPIGSERPCAFAEVSDGEAIFSTDGRESTDDYLEAAEAFTVEADFAPGTFDREPTMLADPFEPGHWRIAPVLYLVGFVLALVWIVRRARTVRRLGLANLGRTFAGPRSEPLPGRRGSDDSWAPPVPENSAPLEFVPPLNLDPVCMLRLERLQEARIGRMMAATLADLAADGIVEIRTVDGETEVSAVPQPPRAATEYELLLLGALFPGYDRNGTERAWVRLDERRSAIESIAKKFRLAVDSRLRSLGLIDGRTLLTDSARFPARVRTFFGLVLAAFFASSLPAVFSNRSTVLTSTISGVLMILILHVWARSWTNRYRSWTDYGAATRLRVGGFRRFMRDSEALHARAAERLGLVREYAGYAVAFDSVNELARAMPDQPQLLAALGGASGLEELSRRGHWRGTVRASNPAASARSLVIRGGGGGGGGSAGGGSGGGGGGSW